MKSCNCTVYLTNPDCSKTCQVVNDQYFLQKNGTTTEQFPKLRFVKKITKTIERYDAAGNYLGKDVITEEVEDKTIETWDNNPGLASPFIKPDWYTHTTLS